MEQNTNNDMAQDKVLILYILNHLNSDITESDLFQLIFPINNINYFYFRHILADLVNSKLIGTYIKEDDETDASEPVFKITSEGKESLELNIDVLPGIVKLNADITFKNEFTNITNEDSIVTEYTPENEHSYTVKCKIIENNKPIFEVRTFAGSNEQARLIADNWKNNAYSIYPKILGLLTENKKDEK